MSSKSEKNIKTSFSLDPKRDYSLSAGLVHETSNKRASFKFAPSLKIQTPTSDVITFAGYAEYKNGKSFKGDVMLAADDFLVKPVRASCKSIVCVCVCVCVFARTRTHVYVNLSMVINKTI